MTLTTCVVTYDSIYNQSRTLSSKSHTRSVGHSKAYQFLVPGSNSAKLEHIVGCLITQQIQDPDGGSNERHRSGGTGQSLSVLC